MADTDLILVTEGRLQRLLAQAVYDGVRLALEKGQPDCKSRLPEEEAAAYIGVSPATLRSWRCRERGPRFIKVGRRVGYLRKDLDAYLSAHVSCPVASLSE